MSIATTRLILWPTLITLAVSVARLVLEVRDDITSATGGRLVPLGISWLPFLFGAWFAYRLRREGSQPRVRGHVLWAWLLLICLIAFVAWNFRPFLDGDRSEETFRALREAVIRIVLAAVPTAAIGIALWPRLGWALLCYAIPARITVVALTWLAKFQGWDTHYTKFGPTGIERDVVVTVQSAGIAQLGFWVPYTILAGCAAGGIVRALTGSKKNV